MPLERGAWYRWFHLFYPDPAITTLGLSYLERPSFAPVVLGLWYLNLDTASHLSGTFSAQAERTLVSFDRQVGRVVAQLERRGLYDSTVLALVADHGMAPTIKNVDLFGELHREGVAIKTLDLSIDPFFPPAIQWRFAGARAVGINLGAGLASLYLRDLPRQDVDRTLREYPTARGRIDLLGRILASEAVDLCMYSVAPGTHRVCSARGVGEIRADRRGPRPRFLYRVVRGEDPLELPDGLCDRWLTFREWIARTARSMRPGAVPGVAGFLATGRGGDLAFTSRPGYNFSRHFHTRGGYHGGLSSGEMVVPLVVAGPGIAPGRLRSASVVDITPTLLTALGIPYDAAGLDGESLLTRGRAAAAEPPEKAADGSGHRAAGWEDRSRLAQTFDPRLGVHHLMRLADWPLGSERRVSPWVPAVLPGALPGSALQVDWRWPAGEGELVASPGLIRTDRCSGGADRLYPMASFRGALPLARDRSSWLGLAGGSEVAAGTGNRLGGRGDLGVLITHALGRNVRAFGCASLYGGSLAPLDGSSWGRRLKLGAEAFVVGRGSICLEAARSIEPRESRSIVTVAANVPAF
ncbi:MAG: alkaline phosphatase family protein [Candidatus Riflebacteria bacterium]|nr:alkaline phosphatase family protein [Candidatus Riflebacteria bacterium]